MERWCVGRTLRLLRLLSSFEPSYPLKVLFHLVLVTALVWPQFAPSFQAFLIDAHVKSTGTWAIPVGLFGHAIIAG
jgi:hypothetical protein